MGLANRDRIWTPEARAALSRGQKRRWARERARVAAERRAARLVRRALKDAE